MRVQLLGPVRAHIGGADVDIGPPQRRLLLAVLAAEAGRPVTTEAIVDRLWAEAPPAARQTVHSHIARIRGLLGRRHDPDGPARVLRRGGGYLLDIGPERVDALRFRQLMDHARDAGTEPARRAELLRDALRMWHGEPLGGLSGHWVDRTREAWRQQRIDAAVAWARAELDGGDAEAVLVPLTELVGEYPLTESLVVLLMRALAAAGRQADALALYDSTRRELAEQFGSDPAPETRDAHLEILRGETSDRTSRQQSRTSRQQSRTSRRQSRTSRRQSRSRPEELPLDPAGFHGRQPELAALDRASTTGSSIALVTGTAGVGKTALAVHWAHRAADRFPDGQLHVDLRGFDPDAPLHPREALGRLLRGLGRHDDDLPYDLDELAAGYRSLVAGRRLLVVLDNAASVEQLRPLLPGTRSCFALVTSRDSLPGLVARDGAYRIGLGLLGRGDAAALLSGLTGAPAAAVTDLVDLCAGLPLALRVAAELVTDRAGSDVAGLVAELRDERKRLDLLGAGDDERTGVRSVLSWSYRHLPDRLRRLFRLVGVAPVPDVGVAAVASLTATDPSTARAGLDALVRGSLMHRTHTGRYAMHDLLRAYARDRSVDEDAQADRHAALTRLFDHYLATARREVDAAEDAPDSGRWLSDERAALVAVATHAADHGWFGHAIALASVLWKYLHTGAHHVDALAVHTAALAAACRTGDPCAEGTAETNVGTVWWRWGRYDRATESFQAALRAFERGADRPGRARVLTNLGAVRFQLGRFVEAADNCAAAVEIFRSLGDRRNAARAAVNLGSVLNRQGRSAEAVALHRAALDTLRAVGDRAGEARALDNLGIALRREDRPEAEGCHRRALVVFQRIGDRVGAAQALENLGTVLLHQGRTAPAIESCRAALRIATDIGSRSREIGSRNALGEALRSAGDPYAARQQHRLALALAETVGDRYQAARALEGIGNSRLATGTVALAHRYWRDAIAVYRALGVPDADDLAGRVLAR